MCEEELEGEVLNEEFEYMVDKIIENEVWRESVKELKHEESAIEQEA